MICEYKGCKRAAQIECTDCGKHICLRHAFIKSCRLDREIEMKGQKIIVPQPLHEEAELRYRRRNF